MGALYALHTAVNFIKWIFNSKTSSLWNSNATILFMCYLLCAVFLLAEMKMGKVNVISKDLFGKSPEKWQTKGFQHPISLCFVNENKTKDFCFSRLRFF